METAHLRVARATALGVVVLLALAGCAGSNGDNGGGSAQPSTSTTASVRVTFVRSGGFAGVHERLEVDRRGHWTYTGDGERVVHGRLTAAQSRQLQRLGNSPALEISTEKVVQRRVCPDTFQYSLTAGQRTFSWSVCHGQPSRTLTATAHLLTEHTPM